MAKLNQIIAVEKGTKERAKRALTDAHHVLQKQEPLSGIERTYKPRDDAGEGLPPESKHVQIKVVDLLERVQDGLAELFEVTATKDWANTEATAWIKVGDTVIAEDVPVTYLLFLEHQLVDLRTFIAALPTLDPAEKWNYDANVDAYVTDTFETTRTKKVPRNHVKAEATDKHPAQVEMYHEDIIVGAWTTRKISGALPAATVNTLLERVEELQRAVKYAREEANGIPVTDRHIAKPIFDFLFEEVLASPTSDQ